MTPTSASRQPPALALDPAPLLRGAPLVGMALDLRKDYLGTMLRAHRDGGDIVRFHAGPLGWRRTLHAVFSPAGVERVLVEDRDSLTKQSPAYVQLRETIGDGLLTSEGETWRRQRRFIAPVLTRRRVTGYAGAIVEESAGLVSSWAPLAASGQQVDAHAEMVRLAADVIGRILFGTDVDDAVPRLIRIGPFVNALLLRRSITPHPSPRWLPTPANRRLAAAVTEMRDIVEDVVTTRRNAPAPPAHGSPAHGSPASGQSREDLLGLLLAARDSETNGMSGNAMTDAEIADQVLVFLLAGHETTATALACALVELARNPHWQHVLHEELDAVIGRRPAAAADVPMLVWTERVVREALRLYPSAHTIGRLAPAGDVILGYSLPPGSIVLVSPWATQRSPDLWPDPGRFDPGRFVADRPGGHRYAWFPFGAGPRACVGAQLAMLEATLVLATLLQTYRLDTELDTIPLRAGITLRPSAPLPVRLTRRG